MNKPKFNPDEPFEPVDKPAFDPNQPFTPIDDTNTQEPQISGLEAAARGVAGGALTPAVNIPLAAIGAGEAKLRGSDSPLLQLYEQQMAVQKLRDKMSAEQHPVPYYGGMLGGAYVSPVGGLLKGAGLVGEAAESAPLLSRIFNAGRTGAAIGGAYGAGEAATDINPDESIGSNVERAGKTVLGGAAGGAAVGGALGTVGEGLSSAVGSLAEKDVPVLSKMAKRFQLGTKGVNLLDVKKLADTTADSAEKLGNEGIAAQISEVGKQMGDAITKATEEGQEIDVTPINDKIDALRTKASTMEDGQAKEELMHLVNSYDDLLGGQQKFQTLGKIGEEEVPGEEGGPPSTKSIFGPTGEIGRISPEEAKVARTAAQGLGPYTMNDATSAAKDLYDTLTEQLVKGVPEYGPLSDKYKLFASAMDDLGVNWKGPGSFYNKTPQEVLSGDRGSVLDPDFVNKLKGIVEKSLTDKPTANKLNLAFDKLKAAGFDNVDALKNNVIQAVKTEDLAGGMPSVRSLVSPIGGMIYKGLKVANMAPNIAGMASTGLQNTLGMPVTTAAAKALTAPVTKQIGETLSSDKTDFLGNAISDTPGTFYKHITAANDDQLKQIGLALKDTPYAYEGNMLVQAIDGGDQSKTRALQFNIATNPKIVALFSKQSHPIPGYVANKRMEGF